MAAREDDVKLPKAIREQLEQAEEIQKQIAEGADAGSQPDGEEQPAQEEQQAAEPPPQEPPSAEEKGADREQDASYWKHKYETLEGKYKAEVPRLHDQTKELAEQIKRLTQEIVTLRAQQQEPVPQEPSEPQPHELVKPSEDVEGLITDADKELHGEDLVDLVQRGAKQVIMQMGLHNVQAALEKLTTSMQELRQQIEALGGQQAKTSSQQLLAELAKRVPDYEEVSQSEEFVKWINEPDPLSGITRLALAQQAAAEFDVDRLAAIYDAFKRETGWQSKEQQAVPASNTTQAPAKTSVSAEQYAEPPKVAAEPSQLSVDKGKIWTESEYQRVYDPRFIREVGEQRAAELQRLADEAVREGRIRWGA